MTKDKKAKTGPSDERVRDVSEAVYRDQLGTADVRRMLAKDDDGGKKLRARAASYDRLTRSYMAALGVD